MSSPNAFPILVTAEAFPLPETVAALNDGLATFVSSLGDGAELIVSASNDIARATAVGGFQEILVSVAPELLPLLLTLA